MALSRAEQAFIHGEVSVSLASADSRGRSSLARVLGTRSTQDGKTLMLVVDTRQAAEALQMIATTGRLAAVFSEPKTDRTLQIKADDARQVQTGPEDLACCVTHAEAFAKSLESIFWPRARAYALALMHADADHLAVVSCTPRSCYRQTPGPGAGDRVRDGIPL